MSSYQVIGAAELRGDLKRLSENVGRGTQDGIEDSAESLVQEARSLAPVATGRLRDSIEASATSQGAEVVVGVEYAIYPEFGTSRMEAQPYLGPAADIVARKYLDNITSAVRKRI